jgi:hypothetical protein
MKLKLISNDSHATPGYGANMRSWGDMINEVYECPCGKGKVYYDIEDILGHRYKNVSCNCEECNEKYNFARGTAILIELQK